MRFPTAPVLTLPLDHSLAALTLICNQRRRSTPPLDGGSACERAQFLSKFSCCHSSTPDSLRFSKVRTEIVLDRPKLFSVAVFNAYTHVLLIGARIIRGKTYEHLGSFPHRFTSPSRGFP